MYKPLFCGEALKTGVEGSWEDDNITVRPESTSHESLLPGHTTRSDVDHPQVPKPQPTAETHTRQIQTLSLSLSVRWVSGKKMDPSWLRVLNESIELGGGLGENNPSQLATISGPKSGRLEGRPACRTVIIRKVDESGLLYFGTREDSLKVDDISNGPSKYAELCWYVEASRKQFRISAVASEVQGEALKEEIWGTYAELEKKRFFYTTRVDVEESEPLDQNLVSAVPDVFRVVKLVPDRVEVLSLGLKEKAERARQFEWDQSEAVEVVSRGP